MPCPVPGQIRCGQSDRLNTRLLIDAGGVDGIGSRIMNGTLLVDRDISVDHHDFLHLAVELGVPCFQVVANLVGLDLVLVEDAPHGAFASVGQVSEASGLGSFRRKPRQCGDASRPGRQAMILGLGARDAHHPGFGFIGEPRVHAAGGTCLSNPSAYLLPAPCQRFDRSSDD